MAIWPVNLGLDRMPLLSLLYSMSCYISSTYERMSTIPDSKVHGANMGRIWGQQDPGGPHVGPMNVVIWDTIGLGHSCYLTYISTQGIEYHKPEITPSWISLLASHQFNIITYLIYQRHDVSNHRQIDCFFSSKTCWGWQHWKKSTPVLSLAICDGNLPVNGGFPSQRASDAESVSML